MVSADGSLHPPLPVGYWYACCYPERPAELVKTLFDTRCASCMIAMEVASRVHDREPRSADHIPESMS